MHKHDLFFDADALMEIEYGINCIELIKRYAEPHRFFHTLDHIVDVLQKVFLNPFYATLSEEMRHALILATLYHDAIYIPGASDNEEKSAALLSDFSYKAPTVVGFAIELIHSTKELNIQPIDSEIAQAKRVLQVADQDILFKMRHKSLSVLIDWEHKIFKEYQKFSLSDYCAGRVSFLNKVATIHNDAREKCEQLINYLQNREYNIGVYPGSFNPMHQGHLDIIKQAEALFDKVIIAQGVGLGKNKPDYPINTLGTISHYERIEYPNLTLVDMVNRLPKGPNIKYHIVRGLRNGDDLAYEENQMKWIKNMNPDIKFVFLHASQEYEHVSSSALRSLKNYEGSETVVNKYLVL